MHCHIIVLVIHVPVRIAQDTGYSLCVIYRHDSAGICISPFDLSRVVMQGQLQYAQRYLELISPSNEYYYFPLQLWSYLIRVESRTIPHPLERSLAVKNLEDFEPRPPEFKNIYIGDKTKTNISVQHIDQHSPLGFNFRELILTDDPLAHKYSLHTKWSINMKLQMFYYEVSMKSSFANAVWYVCSCIYDIIPSLCIDPLPISDAEIG